MEDIFEFLKDYSGGDVIGNSGIYRKEDESMMDFSSRVQKAAQGNGEWGSAGRPLDSLFSNGLVNNLAPVTVNGKQYQQTGEDTTTAEFKQRLLAGDANGKQAYFYNQYDPSSVAIKDPTYGNLMEKDKYDEMVRAKYSNSKDGAVFSENGAGLQLAKLAANIFGGALTSGLGEGFGVAAEAGGSAFPETFSNTLAGTLGSGGVGNSVFGNLYNDALNGTGSFGGAPDTPWGVNPQGGSPAEYAGDPSYENAGLGDYASRTADTALNGSTAPSPFQRLMDSFNGGLGKLNGALGMEKSPISLLDIGKAGGSYLLSQAMASKYQTAAEQAADKANALNDPRRQQYQSQLSQLLTNPQQFYATNPVVQAQLDTAKNQFQANTAKMGTGGTQFNDYLKNVQNVASGTFNDQANLLSGLGGFNQGAGYSGNVFSGLADKGIQASSAGTAGFADIVKKIFGNIGNNTGGQTSPSNTNIVSNY